MVGLIRGPRLACLLDSGEPQMPPANRHRYLRSCFNCPLMNVLPTTRVENGKDLRCRYGPQVEIPWKGAYAETRYKR